jgi:hypothetical protein
MDNIVADSTFYIFFFDDIKSAGHLNCILDSYEAHIGPTIKDEIGHYLESYDEIKGKITYDAINVDFQNILDQYQISLLSAFPGLQKWDKKGEFEVIGLSYLLQERGSLKYLIVDDKAPYRFIKSHLSFINNNLTRTFGFLARGVIDDELLSKTLLQEVIDETEKEILLGNKPINIDKDIWISVVKPRMMEALEECNG